MAGTINWISYKFQPKCVWTRSGSSLTGMLLCEGNQMPNYVYEPMHPVISQITEESSQQIWEKWENIIGVAEAYRNELLRVFSTGAPRNDSKLAFRSMRGKNISDGGDIIVKTIRVRYSHIKGWIEKQQNVKVSVSRPFIFSSSPDLSVSFHNDSIWFHYLDHPPCTWSTRNFFLHAFYLQGSTNMGSNWKPGHEGILRSNGGRPFHGQEHAAITVDKLNMNFFALSTKSDIILIFFLSCRYVRVRYEDIVSEAYKMPILRELYDFMGIPYINVKKNNYNLKTRWDSWEDSNRLPFSLTRDKDFDPNHWTDQLKEEVQKYYKMNANNFSIVREIVTGSI